MLPTERKSRQEKVQIDIKGISTFLIHKIFVRDSEFPLAALS